MIPDSKDNPVSITGAEPYLFVNCWCMHPSFFTRIWFGWFTGKMCIRDRYAET